MNNAKLFNLASKILNISTALALENYKTIPETDAIYVWNPIRGGNAVIISNDETFLFANSSVSPEVHIQAFISGKRTNPEYFKS